MFKIAPEPVFDLDAQITVPGHPELAALRLRCKHLGREALRAWVARASDEGADDARFLGEVLVGWSGVLDADDADVPFGAKALGLVLDAYPAAGAEIFQQYLAALTESRRKN